MIQDRHHSEDSSERTTCDQPASQSPIIYIYMFSLKESVSVFHDQEGKEILKKNGVWVFRLGISIFSMFQCFAVSLFRYFVSLFRNLQKTLEARLLVKLMDHV